ARAGGLARLAPCRRSAAGAGGAGPRRRADRGSGGVARRADRLPRLVVRGRRLPALGRERRDRLGLGEVLALHRLAAHGGTRRGNAGGTRAPGSLAGAPPARFDAARDLVRALADGLRARWPVPRSLLRRAPDASLRSRRAHTGRSPAPGRARTRPGDADPA